MNLKLDYTNFILNDLVSKKYLDNVAVSVSKDGEVVKEIFIGKDKNNKEVNSNTIFMSYKLSRILIVMSFIYLEKQNIKFKSEITNSNIELNLQTNIKDIYLEFNKKNLKYNFKNKIKKVTKDISFIDLITQTSGLIYKYSLEEAKLVIDDKTKFDDYIKCIAKEKLLFNPGEYIFDSFNFEVLISCLDKIFSQNKIIINKKEIDSWENYFKYFINEILNLKNVNIFDNLNEIDSTINIVELKKEKYIQTKFELFDKDKLEKLFNEGNEKKSLHHINLNSTLFKTIYKLTLSVSDLDNILNILIFGKTKSGKEIFTKNEIDIINKNYISKQQLSYARKRDKEFFYDSGFTLVSNIKMNKSIPYFYDLYSRSITSSSGSMCLYDINNKIGISIMTDNLNIDSELILKIAETIIMDWKIESSI